MTYEQRMINVVVYVMYHAEELRVKGLMVAGKRLTDNGMDAAKELIDSGFEPTPEEVETVVFSLHKIGGYSLTETGHERSGDD